jgi:hypothetical protein
MCCRRNVGGILEDLYNDQISLVLICMAAKRNGERFVDLKMSSGLRQTQD